MTDCGYDDCLLSCSLDFIIFKQIHIIDKKKFMLSLQKIFKWNNAHNPGAEYQISELELPSGTQRPLRHSNSPQTTAKNFGADITHGLENVSINGKFCLFVYTILVTMSLNQK